MSSYDQNNVFAKILRGEIPSHRVYEDEHTIAFMDVMPQSNGHTLIVPKQASRNLLDADPAVLSRTVLVVQRIAKAALAAFSADGISVIQYNEQAGGQSVFHLHFHVIPRYAGVGMRPHSGTMESPDVLLANAAKLKAALTETT